MPRKPHINSNITDCLGGGGVYGSPEAFLKLLHAVLNNDSRLLQAHSYDELFKPQLNERCKQSLHNLLLSLGPANARICRSEYSDFRARKIGALLASYQQTSIRVGCGKTTLLWGGMPNIVWVSLNGMMVFKSIVAKQSSSFIVKLASVHSQDVRLCRL